MNGSRFLSPKLLGRLGKLLILGCAVLLHLVLILTITIQTTERKKREDNTIFKIVDLEEYVPPPPEPEKEEIEKKIQPEEPIEVPQQEEIVEEVIETEEEVVTVETEEVPSVESPGPAPAPQPEEIEYLPQHKISVPPQMPVEEIRKRINYPPLANRQRIEGVVFLELFIDREGKIRNIRVLKEPGYGFAEAAVEALEGLTVKPAEANGVPVAVRFRYPIRFKLK
jgi:protein TonB